MANITAMNNIYNYYLTTYAKNLPGSYDTHKKSELRGVYNSIVKQNKESPLFIIDDSDETKSFAVGLKEDARALHNTIASLGGLKENELLGRKVAYSSNPDMVSVEYNGQSIQDGNVPSFEIQVDRLASSQVNIGRFMAADSLSGLEPDVYSFDLTVNDYNYEFQFGIGENDTNQNILERLNRLINNADIGISSDILSDDNGNIALKIESDATGTSQGREQLFGISDTHTSKRAGIVDYLDIAGVTRPASNAEFRINGTPRTAYSNQFTVDNMYTLSLHNIGSTEDETATIGVKDDVESLTENVQTLVNGYNDFLKSAIEYSNKHQKSNYLIRDMQHITANYMAEFTNYGLNKSADGTLSLDREQFTNAALSGDTHSLLDTIKNFTNSTLRKANSVSLDPMKYVDRTIVAYKNPAGPNYATPYITSAYSGMMFNSYC
ncbi:MAG: flagellar filament capping protein FliD [Lachnospiraceae bacterium]|nr:flagellar filament capping protein FliD [Lachnospiraceae bacterium]